MPFLPERYASRPPNSSSWELLVGLIIAANETVSQNHVISTLQLSLVASVRPIRLVVIPYTMANAFIHRGLRRHQRGLKLLMTLWNDLQNVLFRCLLNSSHTCCQIRHKALLKWPRKSRAGGKRKEKKKKKKRKKKKLKKAGERTYILSAA